MDVSQISICTRLAPVRLYLCVCSGLPSDSSCYELDKVTANKAASS